MKLALEPYQEDAVGWITSRDRSALFTSVGLGKTAVVLEAFRRRHAAGEVKNMLVVAPLRVARWTWPGEVEKWAQFRWMEVCDLRGGYKDAHIYTINYESLHKVPKMFFDMVVFDELTRAKNHKSKRIRAFKPLLAHIPIRVGLTGTPASNSLLDLFGQVRVLDDGAALGKSFFQYRQTWFRPTDYMRYNWVPRKGTQEKLQERLSDLALVQSSEDFSDVADADVVDVEILLQDDTRKLYKSLERELILQMREGGEHIVAVNAAVLVGKLLQFAGGHCYNQSQEVEHVHDVKLDALRKLAKDHSPLLVAANYKHETEAILRHVPGAEKWDETTTLERWNRGEIKVLVAHPKSIGHGLNLQAGGHKVCWYSPTWSREDYLQFNARVARKGQTEKPVIFRLIATDTIDEAVVEALRQKESEESNLLTAIRLIQQNHKS